ncbi:MAG TPA: RluA family pseudouridine synthase [Planctomycetota bacterium]|nr:RluA family pseudouridine synthase [Planctomycetota bacterium]
MATATASAPARLDAFLHEVVPGLSRRDARRLCATGGVAVDGVRALPQTRLAPGARVAWRPDCIEATLRLGLSVALVDDDVLVLEKPAHLAAHGGPLVDDSVAARLAQAFPGAGLAHRLDRGASGLLLVGLHAGALRALAAAMESDAIERTYLAVARGSVAADEQTIHLPLRTLDEPRGDRPKVVVDHAAGQPARTHVRVLARRADATLCAVRLATGRTHQIRAHLAAVGHPLLGDPRYGDAAANTRARQTWGVDRPLLHAASLAFPHPATGQRVAVAAWLEADVVRVLPRALAASLAGADALGSWAPRAGVVQR